MKKGKEKSKKGFKNMNFNRKFIFNLKIKSNICFTRSSRRGFRGQGGGIERTGNFCIRTDNFSELRKALI